MDLGEEKKEDTQIILANQKTGFLTTEYTNIYSRLKGALFFSELF